MEPAQVPSSTLGALESRGSRASAARFSSVAFMPIMKAAGIARNHLDQRWKNHPACDKQRPEPEEDSARRRR